MDQELSVGGVPLEKEEALKRRNQGKEGEQKFQTWLNTNEVGFLHQSQDQFSYSSAFKGKIKRPDFLILLPRISLIAVDVKHFKERPNGGFSFDLKQDILGAAEFEEQFKLYMWFAVLNKSSKDDTWHFITLYDVLDKGEEKQTISDKTYFDVPLDAFSRVSDTKTLDRVFSARLGSVGFVARLLEQKFTSVRRKLKS